MIFDLRFEKRFAQSAGTLRHNKFTGMKGIEGITAKTEADQPQAASHKSQGKAKAKALDSESIPDQVRHMVQNDTMRGRLRKEAEGPEDTENCKQQLQKRFVICDL